MEGVFFNSTQQGESERTKEESLMEKGGWREESKGVYGRIMR
jgi:hypothetical protein